MKRIFFNLFNHTGSDIPASVEKRFKRTFHHPVDIEWIISGNDYEALFYENKQEQIARFDQGGNLTELRTNISPPDSSSIINPEVRKMGELMNHIRIKRGENTSHELIIKKPDLTRILVMLDEKYQIIRQETL